MKKFLAAFLTICLIVSSSVLVFPTFVGATDILTATDVNSLNQAIKDVPNGGTIIVDGDLVFSDSCTFSSGSSKTYTITGGSFDFTALTSSDGERGFVHVKDNVTFENTKFIFDPEKNDYIFANGYHLTIKETVVFEGAKVCFFGGVLNANCSSVTATLLSGSYTTINCATNSAHTISGDINVHVGGNAKVNDLLGNSGGCTIGGNVNILVDGNASASGVYGGGNGGTVKGDTYVHIGGNANAKIVYGGGSSGTIEGNTHVLVDGNANTACDAASHSSTYVVYGGGKANTVKGSTEVRFADNAKANYIYGGSSGAGSTIGKGSTAIITGGKAMSVYGGSNGADQGSNANVLFTGGEVEQVFGASIGAALTGDVSVKILGGKITRRIYGGCYNEYASLSWQTSNTVAGNITLTIGDNASITFDAKDAEGSKYSDMSIFARSRYKTASSNEITTIIFDGETAYNNYNGKLKAQDFAGQIMMSGVSAADTFHGLVYTVDTASKTITQTCKYHSDVSATATLGISDPDAKVSYTGKEILKGAEFTYSSDWIGDKLEIVYTNNIEVGTATASYAYCGNTISVNFEIVLSGDANGDGNINTKDIVSIRTYLASYDYNTQTASIEIHGGADANGDNVIDTNDLILLRQYIAYYDYETGKSTVVLGS